MSKLPKPSAATSNLTLFEIGSLIRRKDPLQSILKTFGDKPTNALVKSNKNKTKQKVDITYSRDDSRSIFMILGMKEEYPEPGQPGYNETSYYNSSKPGLYPYSTIAIQKSTEHDLETFENEKNKAAMEPQTKAKRFIIEVLVVYSATNQYFYNYSYTPSPTRMAHYANSNFGSNNPSGSVKLPQPSLIQGISYSQHHYNHSAGGIANGNGSYDMSRLSIVHLHYDFMTMDQVLEEIYENLSQDQDIEQE